jgi:hypothetical protein
VSDEKLKAAMDDVRNRLIQSLLAGDSGGDSFTGTTNGADNDGLTMDKLDEVYELLKPTPIYYATNEVVRLGEVFVIQESGMFPEFVLFNPDETKPDVPGCVWVHVKDCELKPRPFELYRL